MSEFNNLTSEDKNCICYLRKWLFSKSKFGQEYRTDFFFLVLFLTWLLKVCVCVYTFVRPKEALTVSSRKSDACQELEWKASWDGDHLHIRVHAGSSLRSACRR